VIHAPHPATFLENRILCRDFEESIDLARRMDESFNLAAYLAGVHCVPDYWSSRVFEIYEAMSDVSSYDDME
jgi:hypothetical protein